LKIPAGELKRKTVIIEDGGADSSLKFWERNFAFEFEMKLAHE